MSNLNKTIHANDQLRASVEEWMAEETPEQIRLYANMAYVQANALVQIGADLQAMFLGLAAIKLLELVEQKEREGANLSSS